MLLSDDLMRFGLERHDAERIVAAVGSLMSQGTPASRWNRITASMLRLDFPFEVHQYLRDHVFEGWQHRNEAIPLWSPSPEAAARSNLGTMMREWGFADYASLHRWSVSDPEAFWSRTIERLGVRFRRPPSRICDAAEDVRSPEWLPGAVFNICESCFAAATGAPAIVAGSAAGPMITVTYDQLREQANRVANALVREGFLPGDPIALVIDMSPDSVAVYLGIIEAGCVAVSIADSFAAPEIRTRLRITGAKAVFTTRQIVRGGRVLPLYEKVIMAEAPRAIVFDGTGPRADATFLRDGDLTWEEFLDASATFDARECSARDTINILFSSGTTGDPKAIPWTHVTPIKCAADGFFHHDIQPGDVVCWPTSLGWMMGPWLVFATLMNRGTIALFDDVPTSRAFGEFVAAANVSMLGVVPSLVRQWRSTGCMSGLDWRSIRAFSSTGESSNPDDMHYLMSLAGYKPIIEYCGGTEIGGGYITSTMIQPNAPSTFSGPALGNDLIILDEQGALTDVGELFLIPPALGSSVTLVNGDHRSVYFDGTPAGPNGEVLRRHGDQMQRLAGGYYRALGRADDTMNLGGIKVSSAEIERVLLRLEGVREVAAVAINPAGGGPSLLVVFAVVDPVPTRSAERWLAVMQQAIRSELNPLFKVADVRIVERLPRTASNKLLRRQLRSEHEASLAS